MTIKLYKIIKGIELYTIALSLLNFIGRIQIFEVAGTHP